MQRMRSILLIGGLNLLLLLISGATCIVYAQADDARHTLRIEVTGWSWVQEVVDEGYIEVTSNLIIYQ